MTRWPQPAGAGTALFTGAALLEFHCSAQPRQGALGLLAAGLVHLWLDVAAAVGVVIPSSVSPFLTCLSRLPIEDELSK